MAIQDGSVIDVRVMLRNGGSATADDIERVESEFGTLPDSYKDFVTKYDGAKVEPNIFRVSADNESGVNAFIRTRDIVRESKYIETLGRALPIAYAEGGNYVLIDLAASGEVQFWDHELLDEPTPIARDFETFLELIEPFDVSSIRLKPGQVKSAWIDPDFLKAQSVEQRRHTKPDSTES